MAEENTASTSEERAARMGWVPKEEFRGNPDNWVPAEIYVRKAEESLPHLKGTLNTMERKMAAQDEKLKEQTNLIASMKEDMSEFAAFARGAEERAYKKAVAELQGKQREAVEAGDVAAFDAASRNLDTLIAEHPVVTGKAKPAAGTEKPAATAQPKGADAEYQEWISAEPTAFEDWKAEHEWFTTEPEMFAYAQQMDQFLHVKYGFSKPRSERLKELARLVQKKFPAYFGNPAQRKGSPVEGDSGGSPGSNGQKTYNDLPPEAKAQVDKWAGKDGKGTSGTIPGFTRAEYLKSFKW